MKKYLIILAAALAALVSCGENGLVPEKETLPSSPIRFQLTARHPDATKAVKQGWEDGDALFVFFSGVTAPKHLKMMYNGTAWTSAEFDGATSAAGALGLKDGDTGTMTAVFLPFGSGLTVSSEDGSFKFSETHYTYYLSAALPYTVVNNTVSGAFDMTVPEGYVQFFIDDAGAVDGSYTLATDAVIPAGVASIAADGTVRETSDKQAGDDMTGYAYGSGDSKGHLFSGKLNPRYRHSNGYYFAKTKTSDGSRTDYFVSGKTLASRSAVKLPANDNLFDVDPSYDRNGKWIPVGSGKYVHFYRQITTDESDDIFSGVSWATCNYGQSVPEAVGTFYSYTQVKNTAFPEYATLPTVEVCDLLLNKSTTKYFTYTPITVHGQQGFVISADRGFMFLPVTSGSVCAYWAKSLQDDQAWYCYFTGNESGGTFVEGNEAASYAVRLIR